MAAGTGAIVRGFIQVGWVRAMMDVRVRLCVSSGAVPPAKRRVAFPHLDAFLRLFRCFPCSFRAAYRPADEPPRAVITRASHGIHLPIPRRPQDSISEC